jgi:hypothetical protein
MAKDKRHIITRTISIKPTAKRKGYKKKIKDIAGKKTSFGALAKKVAKNYEGKKVAPKYQKEYGKRYSKEEAIEVGRKVAGKQRAGFFKKKGVSMKAKNGGA